MSETSNSSYLSIPSRDFADFYRSTLAATLHLDDKVSLSITEPHAGHVQRKLDSVGLTNESTGNKWRLKLESQNDWNTYFVTALNGAKATRGGTRKRCINESQLFGGKAGGVQITSMGQAKSLSRDNSELVRGLEEKYKKFLRKPGTKTSKGSRTTRRQSGRIITREQARFEQSMIKQHYFGLSKRGSPMVAPLLSLSTSEGKISLLSGFQHMLSSCFRPSEFRIPPMPRPRHSLSTSEATRPMADSGGHHYSYNTSKNSSKSYSSKSHSEKRRRRRHPKPITQTQDQEEEKSVSAMDATIQESEEQPEPQRMNTVTVEEVPDEGSDTAVGSSTSGESSITLEGDPQTTPSAGDLLSQQDAKDLDLTDLGQQTANEEAQTLEQLSAKVGEGLLPLAPIEAAA